VIQIEKFGKSYGSQVAVQDLSLNVAAGQIYGLVGPNGAGKTTTLRALAGVIPPSCGRLTLAGYDVVSESVSAKLRSALIPDDPRLFDTLTVWEHLEFTAAAYRVHSLGTSAEQLLQQFELLEKRDALAQELSRGMRQKLAIVCAYLHEPAVLLFDEPLTGLDPHGIELIQESIRSRSRNGAAIIISSHLLSLVEQLCTHVLILHRGRTLFNGSMPDALRLVGKGSSSASLRELFFQLTRHTETND
jgi:ABC-2 type transport system ATP-binding protein